MLAFGLNNSSWGHRRSCSTLGNSSRSLQQRVQTRVLLEPPTSGSSRPSLPQQPTIASVDSGITDVAYWDLLSHPDIDDSISRAKSASDAAVLRRKGHLKEQDNLIEFMRSMHDTHTCEEVMYKMERWVQVRSRQQAGTAYLSTVGKLMHLMLHPHVVGVCSTDHLQGVSSLHRSYFSAC